MDIRTIESREIIDGRNLIKKGEIVGFNCSLNGELLFAVALNPLNYREQSGAGSFAITKTDRGQLYEIYLSIDDTLCLLTTVKDSLNFHDLQLLSNNELLLVCARSHYRPRNQSEKNGKIYSSEGHLRKEVLLGDGIQNVQSDDNGIIWTSYFDEGIFGNYGWTNPIGQSGLIVWNRDGEKLYEYQPKSPLDSMCDCYALNVTSNKEAWCYYYTDFPLIKIKDWKIDNYWHVPVKGSSAFAVYRNFTLFNGGYNEDPALLHLFELQDDFEMKEICRIQIDNLENIDRIIGRRDKLYFLSDKKVFSVSVQEVL